MEEFLYWEDRSSYPSWMVLKASFQGQLDREALQRAYDEAILRHPLGTALLERDPCGRLFWRLQQEVLPPIQWCSAGADMDQPEFLPYDLTQEGCLRFYVVEGEGRFDIYCQAHHAAVDGLGGMQMLNDLLIHYDRHRGKDYDLPPVKTDDLESRNRFFKTFGQRLTSIPGFLQGLVVTWTMRRRNGAPLVEHAIPEDESPAPRGWPRVVSRRLDPDLYRSLRNVSKAEKVSVNELVVRDFQVTIGEWRRRYKIGHEEDWIRLAVPISLRSWAMRYFTAANIVGVVTIDRQMRSLKRERRARLLFRIHEDMEQLQKKGLHSFFPRLLALYRWLPGGIPARFGRDKALYTGVVTHLGRLFASGPQINRDRKLEIDGAVLEDLRLTAPLRPQALISLDTYVYANRLALDMHYDERFLCREQADDLLEVFVGELKKTCGAK